MAHQIDSKIVNLESLYRGLFELRAEYHRKLDFEKDNNSSDKKCLIEIIHALNRVEDLLKEHEQK